MVRKQAEKQRARNLLLSKLKKTTTTYFKDEGHVVSEFITNIVGQRLAGQLRVKRFLFKSKKVLTRPGPSGSYPRSGTLPVDLIRVAERPRRLKLLPKDAILMFCKKQTDHNTVRLSLKCMRCTMCALFC